MHRQFSNTSIPATCRDQILTTALTCSNTKTNLHPFIAPAHHTTTKSLQEHTEPSKCEEEEHSSKQEKQSTVLSLTLRGERSHKRVHKAGTSSSKDDDRQNHKKKGKRKERLGKRHQKDKKRREKRAPRSCQAWGKMLANLGQAWVTKHPNGFWSSLNGFWSRGSPTLMDFGAA